MGRPPMIPPEKKTRIMLAILAGEISIAEAARKEKVSEQSIGRWKAEFIEAGKTALVAGRSGPSSREEQLDAEVVELTQALREAHVELRVWKKSAEGRLGPSRTSRSSAARRGCRPPGFAGYSTSLNGPGAVNRPEPVPSVSPWGRGLGRRGTGLGRW
jgi:transposase